MNELMRDVHRAVMEFYDDARPSGVEFVKFKIDFDDKGRVVQIAYTEIPPEHVDALLERVREVCTPHGKRFAGMLVNVVVGFKNPSRN
jgi:hypothetical protein